MVERTSVHSDENPKGEIGMSLIERVVPKGRSIFVIPDEVIDRTDSGLYLSDYSAKRPTSGTILSMGPLVKTEDFKKGDRIIYGEMSGCQKLVIDNREIFVMTEDDILALLLPEPDGK